MSYLFICVFVIHTQHFLLHFINFALLPQSAYVSFKLLFLTGKLFSRKLHYKIMQTHKFKHYSLSEALENPSLK